MTEEWIEEFTLADLTGKVSVSAKRAQDQVVHVFVPCNDMIRVTGSCIDPDLTFFKGVEKLADEAGSSIEFILNHMLVDHLAKCETCPKKVNPALLAMSYGAAEMRSIILGHPEEEPEAWEKRWRDHANSRMSTLPIALMFIILYGKEDKTNLFKPREAGARTIWSNEIKKREEA